MYRGWCTLIGLEIFFSRVRVLQLISCTRPYHSVQMSHFISYICVGGEGGWVMCIGVRRLVYFDYFFILSLIG